MKNKHLPNIIIWLAEHLPQDALHNLMVFYLVCFFNTCYGEVDYDLGGGGMIASDPVKYVEHVSWQRKEMKWYNLILVLSAHSKNDTKSGLQFLNSLGDKHDYHHFLFTFVSRKKHCYFLANVAF